MPDHQTEVPPPIQPPPPAGPRTSAPLPEPERQARLWNMLCHLSALLGLCLPFANLWGPLLVWQIKKHEIPSVEYHGKAAFNFQLTVFLAFVASVLLVVAASLFCLGHLLIPLPMLIGLAGIIFSILNGIKANDGQPIHYPCAIEFFK